MRRDEARPFAVPALIRGAVAQQQVRNGVALRIAQDEQITDLAQLDYDGNEGRAIRINPTGDGLEPVPSSDLVEWGDIGGSLSNQIDLQSALTSRLVKTDNLSDLSNITTARTNLGLGTAATANTGSSGANIPLLNGTNTWAAPQTFSANPVVAGGGIAFPATQVPSADLNTLDDYREAVPFTPVLNLNASTAGITYSPSSQVGRCIKIGCLVFFDFSFTLSSKGASVGNATITGLPYSQVAGLPTATIFLTGLNFSASTTGPLATLGNGNSTLTLRNFSAGSFTTMTDANFTNTTTVRGWGFYVA